MDQALDYNRLATEYAQHRRVNPTVLNNLLTTAQLEQNSRVLEVGCGTGNYSIAIGAATACAGFGIDPSAAMLAQAKAHSSEVVFRLGRAEGPNFPPAYFNLIFSVDVIHHVEDRAGYYRAAHRLLKPEGLICTATDSEAVIRRRRPLSNYFPETVAVELDRYPTIAELRRLMSRTGFSWIAETEVALAYPLTDLQPYRERAFSALHLISDRAHAQGMARLEADLANGPIDGLSLYTMLWGVKLS